MDSGPLSTSRAREPMEEEKVMVTSELDLWPRVMAAKAGPLERPYRTPIAIAIRRQASTQFQ